MCLSHFQAHNDDHGDISKFEFLSEDGETWYFENNTKGIGFKIFYKLGFDGKGLGIDCEGIEKTIQIHVMQRNEGLGYEVKELMMLSSL